MKHKVKRLRADLSASLSPFMNLGRFKDYTTELRKRANSAHSSSSKLENGKLGRADSSGCASDSGRPLEFRKFADSLRVRLICILAMFIGCLLFSSAYRHVKSTDPCSVMRNSLLELNYHTERNNAFKPVVPKIIHQQWKDTSIPLKFSKWHTKWKEIFPEPEYTHMLWTDKSGRELIKKHYPFFLKTYDGYQFNIQRADAMRYFILHHYGGVYADLDYEPLVNFWHYIPQDRVAFVESPFKYVELVQNSFMSSPRGDPFWISVFKTLEAQRLKPVFHSTGPSLVEQAFRTNKEPWHMFPCEMFYRISDVTKFSDRSPLLGVLKQQTIDRFYPMKYCGDFSNLRCHFGRHHCSASYIGDTGVLALLWNGH